MTTIPLPPVDEITPGLWVVPVPIPVNPLRYVLVHVFEVPSGVVLVDTGWDTPEAWAALNRGLEQLGAGIDQVRGVLVTHIHPDHYGLAGRVREASGCWVGLHPADAALIDSRYLDVDGLVDQTHAWLRSAGVPEPEARELAEASLGVRPFVTIADPDVALEHGFRPDVPDWELRTIHTPGHSPGHVCFHEERLGTVLTGDHVLPRITPNVSYHPQSGGDPLGDFLGSLDKLRPYGDASALPAHEWRFEPLGTRLEELISHHEERLDTIEGLVRAGAETVWEVAQQMPWSRPWHRIEGFMRRMAVSEVHAHLIVLERRGRLVTAGEEPSRWQLPSGRTAG